MAMEHWQDINDAVTNRTDLPSASVLTTYAKRIVLIVSPRLHYVNRLLHSIFSQAVVQPIIRAKVGLEAGSCHAEFTVKLQYSPQPSDFCTYELFRARWWSQFLFPVCCILHFVKFLFHFAYTESFILSTLSKVKFLKQKFEQNFRLQHRFSFSGI